MATKKADQAPKGAGLAASFDPSRTESMRYFDNLLHGRGADAQVEPEAPVTESSHEAPGDAVVTDDVATPNGTSSESTSPVAPQQLDQPETKNDEDVSSSGEMLASSPVIEPKVEIDQPKVEPFRPTKKGRRLPPLPNERDLPVHLDAAYAPRQVFLRVPAEVRDRLRRLKAERRSSGDPLTDGGALEEGLRLLPDDPSELAALYVSYARKRVPSSVAMAPHVRPEIHLWLGDVTDVLVQMGVRASVNQLAQLALSRLGS